MINNNFYLAPPGVSGLLFVSSEANSSNSVNVTITWERPSDRNGHFEYFLTILGVQPGIYSDSNDTIDKRVIEFNDTGEKSTKYVFSGLSGAHYTVKVVAVNCKRKLPGPEESIEATTVSIGKLYV